MPTSSLLINRKGSRSSTTSDGSGSYLFRSVPPGVYSVTAEMQGFEKTVRPNLKVDVNENATANLTLKVGASSQTVEVQGVAQGVATEDAETGQVVNRRFINDLPLIDRNVVNLTSLAPGVTEMDDQCGADCTGTNFVSNGSRGSTADILTDGASVTNSEPNGGITVGHLSSVAGSGGGVQGAADELQRGIWFLWGVGGQYDHALGNEQVSWKRVRLFPRRQPGRQRLVRQSER